MSKRSVTYHPDGRDIEVRLNGRKVGHIVPSLGGHRYIAIGSQGKQYGAVYPTPAEVMQTLEG